MAVRAVSNAVSRPLGPLARQLRPLEPLSRPLWPLAKAVRVVSKSRNGR